MCSFRGSLLSNSTSKLLCFRQLLLKRFTISATMKCLRTLELNFIVTVTSTVCICILFTYSTAHALIYILIHLEWWCTDPFGDALVIYVVTLVLLLHHKLRRCCFNKQDCVSISQATTKGKCMEPLKVQSRRRSGRWMEQNSIDFSMQAAVCFYLMLHQSSHEVILSWVFS